MKRWIGWLLLCLLLPLLGQAADAPAVRAWLDRDTIRLGETVTLNVEAPLGFGAQPDFSTLSGDFNLLGTQATQRIGISNGVSESKTLWAVALEPKHAGRVVIPALAIGKSATQPLQLTVLAAPATDAPAQGSEDVFLEVEAEPLSPYVQQQVRYAVKLYYAFDLTDGNLAEPGADGLATQRLGQDRSYVATVGGRRYHVIERHYALTPEHSGTIEIPALTFRGSALDAGDPSGFFNRGRAVGARSKPVTLAVKPKPAPWKDAPWLPAQSLLLKDENDLPDEVHVGDPVTRTIRLQAQGLGYEQIPELTMAAPEGAEIYPDRTETRTRDDGEWILGERVRKFAIVPNRPGTMTIPGTTVRWWNTAEDRAETSELPARTIRVLPAADGAAADAAASAAAGQGSSPVASSPQAPHATAAAQPTTASRYWRLAALAGFALWLATLVAWWWTWQRVGRVRPAREAAASVDVSAPRADFLRACALGDLAGAERALVAWAQRERGDVRNLGELAARLDDAAQAALLSDLQRARYAGAPSEGLASRLQVAFKPGIAWRLAPVAARKAALPPLYPPSR